MIPGRAEGRVCRVGLSEDTCRVSRWQRSRSRDGEQDGEMNISEDRPKVGAVQNGRHRVSRKQQQGRLYLLPRFYPSWQE